MPNIQKTSVKSLFRKDEVKQKFQEMLGKRASQFMTSVISVVQSNDKLQQCDPNSVLFAAATAATLDLPVNSNLGHAYIIPYNRKEKDGSTTSVAQFQLGYRGLIQLAIRSGQFETISSTAIYDGQIVSSDPLRGHQFDFTQKKSDKVVGYAAFFRLVTGFEKTLFMTTQELEAHGAKFSKTYKYKNSLWKTDFDSMASKTVLKLLLSKYAPLSIEMQKAVVADQGVINDWNTEDVDYVDNDRVVLDSEAVSKRKEEDRIKDWIEKAKTVKELGEVEDYINTPELHELYVEKQQELSSVKS